MKNETWHIAVEIRNKQDKLYQDIEGRRVTGIYFQWFARDYEHLEWLMRRFQKQLNIIIPDAKIYLDASLLSKNGSDNTSVHTFTAFASWYGPEERFVKH